MPHPGKQRPLIERQLSTPPISMSAWRRSLRGTISKGWPLARSTEGVAMAIHADDTYRHYAEDQDPKALFDKACRWISSIQLAELNDDACDLVDKEVVRMMIRSIYGSNLVERAGLGLELTSQLCQRILDGEDMENVSVESVSENSDDYTQALLEIYAKEPGLRKMPAQHVFYCRSEVVQHTKAFMHLFHEFVVEGKDMTEALIKSTHRILTEGIPIVMPDVDEVPPETYSGVYRSIVVMAGATCFSVPKFIPAHMERMCAGLKEELATAATTGVIDPFATAAKYSMRFVQIHPFQDGNGRMCRMILNCILCRYAGVMVPVGEHGDKDRDEYIGIKRRAAEDDSGPGEYATLVLRLAATRLRELKKKLANGK